MSIRSIGKHRAADVSSTALLLDAAKHHTAPTVKVAGVAAAAGGMVLAASMPAQAATATAAASAPAATAAVGHAASVSVVGVKRKKSTVKRKRVIKKRSSRSMRRTYRKRVNRTYKRVSRTTVRRAISRRPAVKRVANPAPRAVAGGGVLRTAASLSGIYYRYGGTTTSGFDCSGFVGYVFRANGKSLPRTAAAQQRATARVSSPQPGDLVFFGSPAYHVGIYAGGGMMYDSPRTGRTTGLHKIWSSNVTYGRA